MNIENKLLLKGIALMLGAMSVVPMLDVIAKILSESYPVIQVSWARFAFHTLWLLPLLYWKKLCWWRMPTQPGFHLLRSLMLTLATLFFFTAIKTNPIPNALTLLFVSPLVVAMLAPFVLGERFDVLIGVVDLPRSSFFRCLIVSLNFSNPIDVPGSVSSHSTSARPRGCSSFILLSRCSMTPP